LNAARYLYRSGYLRAVVEDDNGKLVGIDEASVTGLDKVR
jgi:hypothetical protein